MTNSTDKHHWESAAWLRATPLSVLRLRWRYMEETARKLQEIRDLAWAIGEKTGVVREGLL